MHALVWKPRMHSKNQSLWSVLNYKLGSEDEVKKKANRQRFAMVTDKLKFCASGAYSESGRVLEALTDESGVWRDSLNAELVKRFPLTLMTRTGGGGRERQRKKERKQGRKGERDRGRKHRERCRKEGREGGREPRMMRRSFKSRVWGQAFWLPLADHLAYLTLSPHLAWLRALCCVCVHLLAKMDSTTRVSGKLTRITVIWFPSRLWPRGAFLYMCRSGGSLTSSIRNMWSLYLLSEQDPAPPCSFHNHLAVICAQGTGDSCWAWDPSTSCFGFVPCPCGAASHPV